MDWDGSGGSHGLLDFSDKVPERQKEAESGDLRVSVTATPYPHQVCGEQHRFEKLMEYFRNEDSNIDFMVSWGGVWAEILLGRHS